MPPVWTDHFWQRVDRGSPDECWQWTGYIERGDAHTGGGYGLCIVKGQPFAGGKRGMAAHRVATILTYGNRPDLLALHTCDNRACCNPIHLYWGTHKDNADDMVRRGRHATGGWTNPNSARVTDDEVRSIRAAVGSERALAKRFGISPSQIGRIRRRQRRLTVL